jgi:hypothetical protein
MATLSIIKYSNKVWKFLASDVPTGANGFSFSKLQADSDGLDFFIVSQGGATTNRYQLTNVTVYASQGGTPETGWTSMQELLLRLEELNFPAWNAVSGSGGATAFIQLTDAPDDYTSQGGKVVAVKEDETGLEFIEGGGGSTPTLQEVTDEGNTTTKTLNSTLGVYSLNGVFDTVFSGLETDNDTGIVSIGNAMGIIARIKANNLMIVDREYEFPDQDGTLALTSDIPSAVTPTLQEVTDEGNETTNDVIVKNSENKIFLTPRSIQFQDIDQEGSTALRFEDTDVADQEVFIRGLGGTMALTSDIPTNTSDLVNDGEDGTSPYVTADQLPSNLNLFATNVSSDIATYFKLVTSIDDPDYNDTAVDIPTGAITTTGQFIAALATTANVLVGNPGIINLLTIGNVRRTSGSGTAEFYYEVYHRTSGGTETLIATSSNTPPVSAAIYTEFLAAALLNNGTFLATDRIVIKYYADRIGSGSNPNYDFQFGGTSPVRTTFPVPASNIPLDAIPTDGSTNGVQSNGVFDALALKCNKPLVDTVSSSALTGVTTEGILKSYLIPANTLTASEILNFANDLYKTGTAGICTSRLYTNTTASLSGASLLATSISTAGNRKMPLRRQLVLKGGNIEVLAATASTPDDNINSSSVATIVTFNPTVDNYLITTAQNANAGDSTLQNNLKLQY